MADIKISKELFLELCRYHLYDPEDADQDFIKMQLTAKLDKAAARERYTAALFAENKPLRHRRGQE